MGSVIFTASGGDELRTQSAGCHMRQLWFLTCIVPPGGSLHPRTGVLCVDSREDLGVGFGRADLQVEPSQGLHLQSHRSAEVVRAMAHQTVWSLVVESHVQSERLLAKTSRAGGVVW